MSSLMKGTAILTIGMFLSKILGLIYIFPFYAIIGAENVTLYSMRIYRIIMLSIVISGAPIAVSKFVAKYNAIMIINRGKLMKSGSTIMLATGMLTFSSIHTATPIAGLILKAMSVYSRTNCFSYSMGKLCVNCCTVYEFMARIFSRIW